MITNLKYSTLCNGHHSCDVNKNRRNYLNGKCIIFGCRSGGHIISIVTVEQINAFYFTRAKKNYRNRIFCFFFLLKQIKNYSSNQIKQKKRVNGNEIRECWSFVSNFSLCEMVKINSNSEKNAHGNELTI